jgi:hypothetical protein
MRLIPSSTTFCGALLTATLLIVSQLVFAFQVVNGDQDASTEYMVKAACIYNFALFVDWPAGVFLRNDSPIVIGIVGADPFGPVLERAVMNRTAKGRPLVVRRLGVEPGIRECQMLFISESETHRLPKIMEFVKDVPILTIGEADTFSRLGGLIALVLENKKVGLQINASATRKAHLNISSKLLTLAKIVP